MDFADFEATVASNNEVGCDNEVGSKDDDVSEVDSLKCFIDENVQVQEDRTYYRNLENVTKSVDETLAEEFNESILEIESFDEVSNFSKSPEEEGQVDEFKDVEKRIEMFEETPHRNTVKKKQSILLSMLYYLH